MFNRSEKVSFSPGFAHPRRFNEAFDPHGEQIENIQNRLREFLSAEEARIVANRVHNLALDTDEEIGRILKDPLVGRLYDYDGQFFTARGTRLFHTAFDGFHLLKWLGESTFESFFRGREKHAAVRWLLEELGKHARLARIRRMNWEESHTLGVLPKEVLEAILKESCERMREAGAGLPALSPEERAFFQSFEEQMERRG
jgi:hypothetical protein